MGVLSREDKMPTLTVVPSPATPSSVVNVSGDGFANAKTRLSLDGQGTTTNIFRPRRDGSFAVGITVSPSVRIQLLVAEQQSGSTWAEVVRTTIPVQKTAPPPVITPVPSGPIIVNTHDIVIDGKSFKGTYASGAGIHIKGTAADPIRNCVIRRSSFSGFNVSIWAEWVLNLLIEDCPDIADADYAGILVFSGIASTIRRTNVRRIGMKRTDLSQPGKENNAYGIALSRVASTDFTAYPRSTGLVEQVTIEDVPLWQGFNTHAGADIVLQDSIIRRTPRPIFVAGWPGIAQPKNISVLRNTIEQAVQVSGGASISAITLAQVEGATIDANRVSLTYGNPVVNEYTGAGYGPSQYTETNTARIP